MESSGNLGLDLTFTDRRMSAENVRDFGPVVRAIREATEDEEVAKWAFFIHICERYPSLLPNPLTKPSLEAALALLDSVELPTVPLELRELVPPDLSPERDADWVSVFGGLLIVLTVGLGIVWAGLQIETYGIPWYMDVRSILVVGLGFILLAVGLEGLPSAIAGLIRQRRRRAL